MPQKGGDPELSWTTIAGAFSIVGLMVAAFWIIFQQEFSAVRDTANADRIQATTYYTANKDELTRREAELKALLDKYLTKDEHLAYLSGTKEQLESLRTRVGILEQQQAVIIGKLAKDPVEDRTFQATSNATDKRIDLIQAQITDINRQIAAALIIIDNNNNGVKRANPSPP
jgi:hypothetical protein